MAWEWSHTPEAYENARMNLEDLSHEELAVIMAEIVSKKYDDEFPEEPSAYKNGFYEKALKNSKETPKDTLVNSIWEFAEEHRTCDNGGFNAYVCPYGCHTVSFDRKEDASEKERS